MKRNSSAADQRQITTLWPERVKRTRSQTRGDDPPAKRMKTANTNSSTTTPDAPTTQPASSSSATTTATAAPKPKPRLQTQTTLNQPPATVTAPPSAHVHVQGEITPSTSTATKLPASAVSSVEKTSTSAPQPKPQQPKAERSNTTGTPTKQKAKPSKANTTTKTQQESPSKPQQQVPKKASRPLLPAKRRKPSSPLDALPPPSSRSRSKSSSSSSSSASSTSRTRLPASPLSSSAKRLKFQLSQLSSSSTTTTPKPSTLSIPALPALSSNATPSASKPPLIPKRPNKLSITSSSPSVPGADALLHDPAKLPDSFSLLLDVMNSMEVSLGLLRTRHTVPTVAAVRDIVQRDTRRDFTLRTLAQLAAVVPECVAVTLPTRKKGSVAYTSKAKLADNLIIRLDDPGDDNGRNLLRKDGASELDTGSKLLRRAFLHRRLLEIVREHHAKFVENRKKKERDGEDNNDTKDDSGSSSKDNNNKEGDDDEEDDDVNSYSRTAVWHPDFDPNRDVPQLPAPPLFTSADLAAVTGSATGSGSGSTKTTNAAVNNSSSSATPSNTSALLPGPSSATGSSQSVDQLLSRCEKKGSEIIRSKTSSPSPSPSPSSPDDDDEEEEDNGIPKALLARVRSRERTKEHRLERAEEERASSRNVLAKLPVTMDSINTVLRTEKRNAMGWAQLINKVAKVHPRKWPKVEIEEQMDAITQIAKQWCTKVELKSSRGGFAFKIVSEKMFAQDRAKVCATQSL